MKTKKINIQIYLAVLSSILLANCQQGTILNSAIRSPTPLSSSIPSPTSVPSATPTLVSLTPTPGIQFQLTYVAACKEESQCIYSIEVTCLESEHPCLSEPQLLFEIDNNYQGPRPPIHSYSWSPDGQQIAIGAAGLGGKEDVYIGDWNGENWNNLTDSQNYEVNPVWSPDGRYITYTAKASDPDYFVRCLSIQPDGTGVLQLLSTLDFLDVLHLIWLPDGERVAFLHTDERGYWQIFIANQDGSNLVQLTRQAKDHGLASISPDGQWILFTLETERGSAISNIYLIHTNGNIIIAVTDEMQGYRSSPVWSPQGDWIAFEAKMDGNYDIYLIRSDGSGLINVTQSVSDEHAPVWRVVMP